VQTSMPVIILWEIWRQRNNNFRMTIDD